MTKRVALMTIYQVPNYGSVLQAYASQIALEKLDCKCDIIQYQYPNEWHYKKGMPRPTLKSKIGDLIPYWGAPKKRRMFNAFRQKHYHFTEEFGSLEDLEHADWSKYDTVITGSDQVWKAPFNHGDKAFLLSFVPDDIRKISLAASFAMDKMPEEYKALYKKQLSRYTAISVRENDGLKILYNDLQLSGDFKVLLDPTLLLSKDDWKKAIGRSEFIKKEPYILLYMLDYAYNPVPYIYELIEDMGDKNNIKNVYVLEDRKKGFKSDKLHVKNYKGSDVETFIDLFLNADLVITSSFHGTAFAANFGIPLLSVVSSDDKDGRISSLLKNIGLNNCIIPTGKGFDGISPKYNVTDEQQRLKALRQDSVEWIQDNNN